MSDRRIEKEILLEYTTELIQNAGFVGLISYKGLDVDEVDELRARIAASDCVCRVLKNTFIELAARNCELECPDDFELTGDTALVCGSADDPVSPAKAIVDFAKDHEQVAFKGGWINGAYRNVEQMTALADMPTREQSLSMLLGVIKAPGQRLVSTLSQRRNTVVWTLQNYMNKLEDSA